jgi:hypothetical protein
MSDTGSYSDPWHSPEHRPALDEFHQTFGITMAAWAMVEDGLCDWFKLCTGLHEQFARAVFYSARSFAGRRDMLVAAIRFSSCNEKTQTGIRLCVKYARKYSEFRNRIGHGHLTFTHTIQPPQFVFAQGRSMAGPLTAANLDYVTVADLKIAATNFQRLTDCILGFHPGWQAPDVCERGCLEEIRALPIEANSTKPSQIGS